MTQASLAKTTFATCSVISPSNPKELQPVSLSKSSRKKTMPTSTAKATKAQNKAVKATQKTKAQPTPSTPQPQPLSTANPASAALAPVEQARSVVRDNVSQLGEQITAVVQADMENVLTESLSQLDLGAAVSTAFNRVFNPVQSYDLPEVQPFVPTLEGATETKKQLSGGSSS